MRSILVVLAGLVWSAGLAGCANGLVTRDAILTYETVPEGAMLFEAGQSLGVAPQSRTYKHDGKSETIRTPEVMAVWPSGAKETFWTLLPTGADRIATIERPKGAPGLQADLDNARKAIAAKEREALRIKEAAARDIARGSQRCKDQMSKGNVATADC